MGTLGFVTPGWGRCLHFCIVHNLVYLVYLVSLVCLVYLVGLVSLVNHGDGRRKSCFVFVSRDNDIIMRK